MDNSLRILAESLDLKIQVLKEIQEYNEKQKVAFSSSVVDYNSFDQAIEEKDRLIERMLKLEEGFDALYSQISEELKKNKAMYATQISTLQDKIRQITDMSVAIQAQEARNKKLIEDYFAREKSVIRQNRKGSKAAYDYYKNMSGAGFTRSQYLDQKN